MPSVRHGRTEKDRKSGANQRNQDNKQARVEMGHANPFPRSSCNGRENRFRYTSKCGVQVVGGAQV